MQIQERKWRRETLRRPRKRINKMQLQKRLNRSTVFSKCLLTIKLACTSILFPPKPIVSSILWQSRNLDLIQKFLPSGRVIQLLWNLNGSTSIAILLKRNNNLELWEGCLICSFTICLWGPKEPTTSALRNSIKEGKFYKSSSFLLQPLKILSK